MRARRKNLAAGPCEKVLAKGVMGKALGGDGKEAVREHKVQGACPVCRV